MKLYESFNNRPNCKFRSASLAVVGATPQGLSGQCYAIAYVPATDRLDAD